MTAEPLRSRWDMYEPRAEQPLVGSTWVWEPNKPHAREKITVLTVQWNGEAWWVETAGDRTGTRWNDLGRFWEACWPDPDPNDTDVGDEIRWSGRPSFAKALPSGWDPRTGTMRWSRIGEHLWRRIA
jgi:hypothetical protein